MIGHPWFRVWFRHDWREDWPGWRSPVRITRNPWGWGVWFQVAGWQINFGSRYTLT